VGSLNPTTAKPSLAFLLPISHEISNVG